MYLRYHLQFELKNSGAAGQENWEKTAMPISVVEIADSLVRREMASMGVKRPEAERNLARRAGLAPSAIENLRRGRLKSNDSIGRKLTSLAVKYLESQIAALESELAIARAIASGDHEPDLRAAEAAISRAREALGRRAR